MYKNKVLIKTYLNLNLITVFCCGYFVGDSEMTVDHLSSFLELLWKKYDSVTVHQRNQIVLSVVMYKIIYKVSPEFIWNMVKL